VNIRWYKIALRPSESDLPASWPLYLGVLVLLVASGGLFATMWRDNSPVKCFYFGACFPAFVSSITALPPPPPR
jgi:hypothetical protein